MAIDHRIALQARTPTVDGAINIFQNALNSRQNREQQQQQMAQSAELQPFAVQQQQQIVNKNREVQRMTRIHETGQRLKPLLESGDLKGAELFVQNNINEIQKRINNGSNEDITESLEALAMIQGGKTGELLNDINMVDSLVNKTQQQSLGQREFEKYLQIAQDPNATQLERDSAKRALGAMAKAGTSLQERIANNPELAQLVADSQAKISGAKASETEGKKLETQLKFKPSIARAIKLAEKSASEQGEVLTDLARAEAGLPSLIEATNNLKELANVATSTYGGRFFDVIAKESGWGTTEGANARAKYIAIIDNQVLPLLKQTFGGAMTEGEGKKLTNTLGDPNASPEQKIAQTEAFIEQKLRNIRDLKAQAKAGTQSGDIVVNFDAQGNIIQ